MVTKNQRIAGSRKSVCEASSYQTQNTGVAPHAGSVD